MGDTQPFVSLAVRLKQQGHTIRLAARPDFASLAASYGIEFAPLGNSYKSLLRSEDVATAIGSGNILGIIRQASDSKQRSAFFDRLDKDTWRAVEGAEAIVYKSSWIPFYSIAEKLKVPCIAAMLFLLTRTRSFPSFLIGGGKDRGRMIDSLIWRITEQFVWQVARRYDNETRREFLNLPPLPFFGPFAQQDSERMPLLYAYSPAVLPRPEDWSDRIHVTGYWFSHPPPGWTPPPDLVAFLEDGPPPVYVGFGSMPSGSPESTLRLILQALELSHQRGVLLSGWAGIGEGVKLPEYAFGVEGVPHSWLFPRMAAVVHHGGAGTTAAGLRAGVPSVITPFVADQPGWARRIEALGVGARPIPFRELTADLLASAIRAATSDAAMRERAASIGELIRAEDGLGKAVQVFTDFVRSRA
jgi:UDP:flavonoid glycosyltransferase YjiC (YdhE family)